MKTKSELRRQRKAARAAGQRLTGELATDQDNQPFEFSESYRGYVARYRWAKRYDQLNGAPEGDYDR